MPCAWNAGALPIGLIITFQRALIGKVAFEQLLRSLLCFRVSAFPLTSRYSLVSDSEIY